MRSEPKGRVTLAPIPLAVCCIFTLFFAAACVSIPGSSKHSAEGDPPPAVTPPPTPQSSVSVVAAPLTSTLQLGQTQTFTATVVNDPQSKGVSWSLSQCAPGTCGTLSATSSASGASITYTAPTLAPASPSILLTATSLFDSAKTAAAAITVASPAVAISVSISPRSQSLAVNQSQSLIATVQNDAQNKGVTWTISGTNCQNNGCGTLSSITSASGAAITYTAPAHVPSSPTITIMATSVADSTASASATLTISSPADPPVTVAVTPSGTTVPVKQSQHFTATVQNDSQNKGVTWSLSGTGCSGSACGTLSSATSASGMPITYTAPANAPDPAAVTLTATSVANSKASASVPISISVPIPPITVDVAPTTQTVAAGHSQAFTATVRNDHQSLGVTWSLSGRGCSSTACGSLSRASSPSGVAVTYTAPAAAPNPPSVTLAATSVADPTSSAAADIAIDAPTPQVLVVTQHNDIARSGANTTETILTPANVNSPSFGKLFSQPVDGYVYAQPLYVPSVTMGARTPQAGTLHNVVFVATENDSVYAFDADNNSSANTEPLWHASLLDAAHGAAPGARPMYSSDNRTTDLVPLIGITGTPVIDPATGTLYVAAKTNEGGAYIYRLHALDITTGQEKFGGPVELIASVPGNGTGSVAGILQFDPYYENQRAGLLLLNGIVYMAFGSHGDYGPWHGWILAYEAKTLRQTGVWCTTPNNMRGGIWGAGVGLAADVPDPANHPFGRLFTASGNGTFDAVAPNYTNAMNYGDSVIKLDLTDGVPSMTANGKTVGDSFTPFNQDDLGASDQDQGAGAPVVLPDSASGGKHLLVQAGKSGAIYIIDQEKMGGYHPSDTVDPQKQAGIHGLWGAPAYWNGNLYFWGYKDNLRAFSYVNGLISPDSTSVSAEFIVYPPSIPAVSANGNKNGIVWNIVSDKFASHGSEILQAHDANDVSRLLYSSDQNLSRDDPGPAVKFAVPTVVNGKVYVGSETQLSVFGPLN